MTGTEAVENSGFGVIQIRQPQNDFVRRWFPASLAHIGGLHAAEMHKVEQPSRSRTRVQRVHSRFTTRGESRNEPIGRVLLVRTAGFTSRWNGFVDTARYDGTNLLSTSETIRHRNEFDWPRELPLLNAELR